MATIPTMRIHATDEVFVRATRADVHAYLADPGGYGAWWPGARSRGSPAGAWLELATALPGRSQRLHLAVAGQRRDLGVAFRLRGDAVGKAEWYYLDEPDGTRVTWLIDAAATTPRARRWLEAHRAAVRRGQRALKDLLESGRAVGADPEPDLLARQDAAIAAFEAGVERYLKRRR